MEEADLVIVGAGIYGLTMAHTYHCLHPLSKILVLDSSPSIGGPWAPHRIFPGLKTNNLWGMYEHPDFPMDEQRFRVKRGEHIDAASMFDYLCAFVEWADIKHFIRLRTAVETIEKDEEEKGWILHCAPSSLSEKRGARIKAKKLVIAVGNTNTPLLPEYPTSPKFRPLVVHAKDFAAHYADIVKPETHTVVVGSGKSAWDVAYACTTQPSSTATLLIRPDGNGPVWMAPTHVTPLGLWLEKLVHTRFFGFMSPCPWAATTGIEGYVRSLLHGTWLGRKIVGAFWHILGEDAIALHKLDAHPETKKLRPWRSAFEVGNALSIHNYPTSFFDLVRDGRIKVLIDDIAALQDPQHVALTSGSVIQADAVVCATGWQKGYTFRFQPAELEKSLGVPLSLPLTDEEESLVRQAQETLYTQFPYLQERDTRRVAHPDATLCSNTKAQQSQEQKQKQQQQQQQQQQRPYRLHYFIAPPHLLADRNIAFAGALHCLATFPCAYLQALWITSFLDASVALPSLSAPPASLLRQTYRNTQYCVVRGAMSYGHTLPDLVFDSLPYFDALLRDVDVDPRRKGGARVWDCVSSYGPEDYRGLLDVLVARRRDL